MNIIDLQDSLKDLPDSALMREMQMPSGSAPQFLVLSELKRRKRMRDEFQRQQNMDMPTVAEEVVTAAGMPQQGIMGAARAMAPNTNVAQNTGMDMAAPVPATRAPQPQMMADGGVLRYAPGGTLGGTVSAVAMLKTKYPEIYEAVKDDPYQLQQAAEAAMRGNVAREPEMSGIESLETDMTAQAAPFEPTMSQFTMDTSGETRPIGAEGTLFNLPMGQIGEFMRDPFRKLEAGTGSYEDYELQYEPAKPGEYYYKGNAFILGPDGSMIERNTGIPITESTKAKILAANLTRTPIEGYGEADNTIAPLEKLMEDRQEGTPVESVTNLIQSMSGQPVEVDPAEIVAAQAVTPRNTPDMSGLEDAARLQEIQRMMEINALPESPDAPTIASTDAGLASLRAAPTAPSFSAGDSATIGGSSTSDFAYEPGSPAETDAIREYLRGEGARVPSIIDEIDSGNKVVTSDRVIEDRLGARDDLYFDRDPIGGLLNRRAQEYLQSDLSTPKEEVYSSLLGGDPRETAKYEEASQEERDRISDAIYQDMLERDRLAEKRMDYLPSMETDIRDQRERDLRAEERRMDYLGPVVPDSLSKTLVDAGVAGVEAIGDVISSAAETGADMAIGRKADKSSEVVLGAGAEITPQKSPEAAAAQQEIENLRNQVAELTKSGSSGGTAGEAAVMKALSARQKAAESDKWMALARTGAAIMASKSPTLGGAVGEGLGVGLESLSKSKKQAQDYEIAMAKVRAAMARSGRAKTLPASALTSARSAVEAAQELVLSATTDPERLAAQRTLDEAIARENALKRIFDASYGVPVANTKGTGGVKNINLTGT